MNNRYIDLSMPKVKTLFNFYFILIIIFKVMFCFGWNHQKKNGDPIDYESIHKVDFWIIEEEGPSELDDIDNVIYHENETLIDEPSKYNEG